MRFSTFHANYGVVISSHSAPLFFIFLSFTPLNQNTQLFHQLVKACLSLGRPRAQSNARDQNIPRPTPPRPKLPTPSAASQRPRSPRSPRQKPRSRAPCPPLGMLGKVKHRSIMPLGESNCLNGYHSKTQPTASFLKVTDFFSFTRTRSTERMPGCCAWSSTRAKRHRVVDNWLVLDSTRQIC